MKPSLILIVGLVVALGAGAFGAYGALRPRASRPPLRSSDAIQRVAFAHADATAGGIAPGVQELARNEGFAPAALKRVAVVRGAHLAVVYAVAKGRATCAYLTGGTGGVGGCMQPGSNVLTPRVAIVDGGTYVWGLAAPSVAGVGVDSGGQTFSGSVANGIFAVEIVDGSHGTGPITVTATLDNGSTTNTTLPGIPTPLP